MSEPENDVLAFLHRWLRATRDRDLVVLEELLAEDFTLTTGRADKEVRSRREWLEVTAGDYVIEQHEIVDAVVHDLGRAAVIRSWYRQRARMGAEDRSEQYLMTDVLVRSGDRWTALCRHLSPLGSRTPGRDLRGDRRAPHPDGDSA